MSVLHQNLGRIGKSIPSALKISLELRPRKISRVSGNLSDVGDGFPNTSFVLVEQCTTTGLESHLQPNLILNCEKNLAGDSGILAAILIVETSIVRLLEQVTQGGDDRVTALSLLFNYLLLQVTCLPCYLDMALHYCSFGAEQCVTKPKI